MNKFFKLFSSVAALFLIIGLTGCFFDLSNNPEISNSLNLKTFLTSEAGETGTLTADIPCLLYVYDVSGKTKTLDLNGHTISFAVDSDSLVKDTLQVFGTLKIIDSSAGKTGKIICETSSSNSTDPDTCAIRVKSGGRVIIEAGIYEASGTGIIVDAGGRASITGSSTKIISGNTGILVNGEITTLNCNVEVNCTAIENNGTITTISGGGYVASTSTSYVGKVYALWNKGTIGTISGGNFSATNNGPNAATSYAFGLENSQGEITTISGGTFGAVYPLYSAHAINSQGTITTVSGATFTPPLSN